MRYLIDDVAMLPATAIFTGTIPVDDMLRAMWCFEDGGYTYDKDYATQYQNYITSSGYEILDKDVVDCRTGEEYKRWSKAPLHSPNEGDEIILATYEDGKLVLKNFAIEFKLGC